MRKTIKKQNLRKNKVKTRVNNINKRPKQVEMGDEEKDRLNLYNITQESVGKLVESFNYQSFINKMIVDNENTPKEIVTQTIEKEIVSIYKFIGYFNEMINVILRLVPDFLLKKWEKIKEEKNEVCNSNLNFLKEELNKLKTTI